MRAWGPGSFENDDALDWLGELAASDDGAGALFWAFEAVVDGVGYAEAAEASAALAAAEMVAALHGRPAAELPEDAAAWIRANAGAVSDEALPLARAAVERVRRSSELRDLWDEADPAPWYAAVNDLLERLATAGRILSDAPTLSS
jgi:hypothetical protein